VLKNLFVKPLQLELDERTVSFNTPGDFEFCLASRTEVPAAKIAELVRMTPDALRREASKIREVEKRFVEVIAKSIEETGSIGYLLADMDLKLFSQDHAWRSIIAALARQPREFDEFKKIALVKYVQYLASRQDVLKSLYAARREEEREPGEPEGPANPALRQTLIFDLSSPDGVPVADSSAAAPTPRASLERLPRGETVTIALAPGEDLRLVLSRHRFTLTRGARCYLADENGGDYLLRPGRNLVGRQPGNDVVVDSGYRDVSRKHLIIDIGDEHAVRLTDLSAHGTYVPGEVLGAAPG